MKINKNDIKKISHLEARDAVVLLLFPDFLGREFSSLQIHLNPAGKLEGEGGGGSLQNTLLDFFSISPGLLLDFFSISPQFLHDFTAVSCP